MYPYLVLDLCSPPRNAGALLGFAIESKTDKEDGERPALLPVYDSLGADLRAV